MIKKYVLMYCKLIQKVIFKQLLRNNSFLMNVFVKVAVVCQLLWPREICLTAFLERNPNTETPDEYDMRAHFASLRVRLSPRTHSHTRTQHFCHCTHSYPPPPQHHVCCIVNLFTYCTRQRKSSPLLRNFTEIGFRILDKSNHL